MGKWRNKSVEIVIEKYQCSIFMYLRASWSRQLPHSTNCCQSNLSVCTFEDITLKLQQNINNWTYRQLDFLFFAIISFFRLHICRQLQLTDASAAHFLGDHPRKLNKLYPIKDLPGNDFLTNNLHWYTAHSKVSHLIRFRKKAGSITTEKVTASYNAYWPK